MGGSPRGHPKSLAGWGEGGERRGEEFGRVNERLRREENNACLPESKGSTHEHRCLRDPAPRGQGRRGAEPPPSGRVVASQTAGPGWRGGGSTQRRGGSLQRHRDSAERGGRRKRGICSSWEGGPQDKRSERRNRLMLCRTPRVFLSGGITSTFRQEQELGGKQQHGLTARR